MDDLVVLKIPAMTCRSHPAFRAVEKAPIPAPSIIDESIRQVLPAMPSVLFGGTVLVLAICAVVCLTEYDRREDRSIHGDAGDRLCPPGPPIKKRSATSRPFWSAFSR